MKPKIHLNGSLGLLMFGIGSMPVLLVAIALYEDYMSALRNGGRIETIFDMPWSAYCVVGLGIGFIISGVALIFKVKWSRFAASMFILMGTLWWTYIVYDEFRFKREFWIEFGICSFVYILLLFGLLFLGNDKVRKNYGEADDEDHWDDKILDV